MKGKQMKTNLKEKAVLVTTQHRGVFFGYATDTSGDSINLRSGRMCIYWSADLRGVVGLAVVGPGKDCRVGPATNMNIRDVTAVMEVSKIAVRRWEEAPWK
jgi:hypothetical protein